MEFKGTKGDWGVKDLRKTSKHSTDVVCGKTRIAEVKHYSSITFFPNDPTKEEGRANAKLIAASKELLELALLVKRITNRKAMPTEMEVLALQEQSEKAINKALTINK
jgi:hypothetical protein